MTYLFPMPDDAGSHRLSASPPLRGGEGAHWAHTLSLGKGPESITFWLDGSTLLFKIGRTFGPVNILISVSSNVSRGVISPAVTVSVAFAPMVVMYTQYIVAPLFLAMSLSVYVVAATSSWLRNFYFVVPSSVCLLESYWCSFVFFPASRRLQLIESMYTCSRCADTPWFRTTHCRILFLSGWHNGQNHRTLFFAR